MSLVSEPEADKQAYLRAINIFRDLSHAEVEELGRRAPMRRVPAGTIFYSPDQPTEVLFILKEGRVRLYHLSPGGRELTLALLDEGTIFGEMALLGQRLHSNFAQAATACLLCLMSREDVKALLLDDPRIAYRLLETVGQRLQVAERRLADLAFRHAPERVAAELLALPRQAGRWPGRKGAPEIACTHEELAGLVGVYRETVTKVLNDFRQRRLIELKRGRVVLRDLEGLRALAEEL
ncbi:MAG: Crp/Fnr family transcriptional regulator [Candidatus Promineifilaceae bacterium]